MLPEGFAGGCWVFKPSSPLSASVVFCIRLVSPKTEYFKSRDWELGPSINIALVAANIYHTRRRNRALERPNRLDYFERTDQQHVISPTSGGSGDSSIPTTTHPTPSLHRGPTFCVLCCIFGFLVVAVVLCFNVPICVFIYFLLVWRTPVRTSARTYHTRENCRNYVKWTSGQRGLEGSRRRDT